MYKQIISRNTRHIATFLAAVVLMGCTFATVRAQSWDCGKPTATNVVATLNTFTGELIFTGSGAMADYANAADQPWASYRTNINKVIVSDGITSIGDRAFEKCVDLLSASIGSDVVSIGQSTFSDCKKGLTEINIPNSVQTIGSFAFSSCGRLEKVTLGTGLNTIGGLAFDGCESLRNFIIYDETPATLDGEFVFFFVSETASVFVPCGKAQLYATEWGHFKVYTAVSDFETLAECPGYSVSIATLTNGTVTSDKADYKEGETVTLTVMPDEDYELNTITVYKTGDPAVIVETELLQHTFTMPAYDVTVTAAFKYIPINTGMDNVVDVKSLRAYIRNGTLYVSGPDVDKMWRVYSVSGTQIYQSHANGEGTISLPFRGVYIVKSGNETVKAVY